MAQWSFSDIPSQHERTSIVTGTGGVGFETALALTRVGGNVILAGRNPEKGAAAIARIKAAVPQARIVFEVLDLASLASVNTFSERMLGTLKQLNVLINNAGIGSPPKRGETADGFELQLGTNHLGHFALTAHLLPLLQQSKSPRVVSLSSLTHRGGVIDFDDMQSARSYKPMRSYAQSKLATLMFALELQRRSDAGGWGLISNAAHPGYARTDLIANGPGESSLTGIIIRLIAPIFSQSAADGALPTLYAATSPDAKGGGYYGPDRLFENKGHPAPAKIAPQALDRTVANNLWNVSEQLTGLRFDDYAARQIVG